MNERPIRVAVVGVAGIGKTHMRLLCELSNVSLAAVCDTSPTAMNGLSAQAPRFYDYDRMLDTVRPDAVILATPPASHLGLTIGAARRKVHVFVEKPIAETVASAQAMIDVCRQFDVCLMVGHKKRFLGAFVRLRELLHTEIGRPQVISYRYLHPGRSEKSWFWEEGDGGGPLRENAVHAADLLRWLAGDVIRIYGEADYFTFQERAPQLNCAVMTLRFLSGAIACLSAGMVGTPALATEELFVTAEGGVAEVRGAFDNPQELHWARRGDRETRSETFAGNAFTRELEHFLGCIRTGTAPLSSGEEALRSLDLCERWKSALGRPAH